MLSVPFSFLVFAVSSGIWPTVSAVGQQNIVFVEIPDILLADRDRESYLASFGRRPPFFRWAVSSGLVGRHAETQEQTLENKSRSLYSLYEIDDAKQLANVESQIRTITISLVELPLSKICPISPARAGQALSGHRTSRAVLVDQC